MNITAKANTRFMKGILPLGARADHRTIEVLKGRTFVIEEVNLEGTGVGYGYTLLRAQGLEGFWWIFNQDWRVTW